MINILTSILMVSGLIVFLGVSFGVVRFPDCYTRIHAAAKSDTLSSALFLLGIAIYNISDFSWETFHVSLKLILVLLFVSVASPTASHALVHAAYGAGLMPWKKDNKKEEKE